MLHIRLPLSPLSCCASYTRLWISGTYILWFFIAYFCSCSSCFPGPLSLFQGRSVEDTQHLVRRKHVKLVGSMLLVMFHWIKTLQAGGRVLVIPLVPMTGSPLCPVAAYNTMLWLVPASATSPAFVLPRSLNPVLYLLFQTVFRHLVAATGFQAPDFSSHSFCRGGATFTFQCGVPGS